MDAIAFRARITHDNHNNALLIDRVVAAADYQLALVLSRAFAAIREAV